MSLQRYALQGVTETGKELGRGSYAVVLEVEYRGLTCAAKKIHEVLCQEGTQLIRRFQEECQLLSELKHPNIVQFLGVYLEPSSSARTPALVMEYLPLTLAQALDKYGVFAKNIYLSVLKDIALGLNYLHQHSPLVLHRDLSANNVLLTQGMNAKLSDLGIARLLELSAASMQTLTQAPGTQCYMPPEALVPKPKYNAKVDIFSYGVLVIHVLTATWPFPGEAVKVDPTDESKLLPQSEVERRKEYLQRIRDQPLTELIHSCIHNSPTQRPEACVVLRTVTDLAARFPFDGFSKLITKEQPSKNELSEALSRIQSLEMSLQNCRLQLSRRAGEYPDGEPSISNEKKVCTYHTGGDKLKKYVKQPFFRCITCFPRENYDGCCADCASVCHAGHKLKDVGEVLSFCDCGLNYGKCKIGPKCTYDRCGTNATKQVWYECHTCWGEGSLFGCCELCASTCHKQHLVVKCSPPRIAVCSCGMCDHTVPKCTFAVTGKVYKQQPFYRCLNCFGNPGDGCCYSCAHNCHVGHHLQFAGKMRAFCDCGCPDSSMKCKLY